MPPLKSPSRARRNWFKTQECAQCGHRGSGLTAIQHGNAPPLKWTLKGPSHHRLSVACKDAGDCLRRRAALGVSNPAAVVAHVDRRGICDTALAQRRPRRAATKRPTTKKRTTKKLTVKPPPPRERHELPLIVERHAAALTRIEEELAKPDKRPRCPNHGERKGGGSNTMLYDGAVRFTCCGRVVPGAKPRARSV